MTITNNCNSFIYFVEIRWYKYPVAPFDREQKSSATIKIQRIIRSKVCLFLKCFNSDSLKKIYTSKHQQRPSRQNDLLWSKTKNSVVDERQALLKSGWLFKFCGGRAFGIASKRRFLRARSVLWYATWKRDLGCRLMILLKKSLARVLGRSTIGAVRGTREAAVSESPPGSVARKRRPSGCPRARDPAASRPRPMAVEPCAAPRSGIRNCRSWVAASSASSSSRASGECSGELNYCTSRESFASGHRPCPRTPSTSTRRRRTRVAHSRPSAAATTRSPSAGTRRPASACRCRHCCCLHRRRRCCFRPRCSRHCCPVRTSLPVLRIDTLLLSLSSTLNIVPNFSCAFVVRAFWSSPLHYLDLNFTFVVMQFSKPFMNILPFDFILHS